MESVHHTLVLAVYLQVALKVGMSCQGCVGSVNRVLSKLEGAVNAGVCI
jgi:Heavy-metal-associated domain